MQIAVLFGGVSTEHDISCISAAGVIDNMDRDKYNITKVGITKSGSWFVYEGDTDGMRSLTWSKQPHFLKPAVISPCTVHHGIVLFDKSEGSYSIKYIDVVFPILHGSRGEDGTMQGLLKISGLPFVGCSTYSSAVCMDKVTTKILCEREGIKTVPFVAFRKDPRFDYNNAVLQIEDRLEYPVFVKPANSGSSVGVSKATNSTEVIDALKTAFLYDYKVLVEKTIVGKEIEVAVLGNRELIVSPCGEINPNNDFYDYDTKYKKDTAEFFIPARIGRELTEEIRTAAERIYKLLDCSGLARIDFFADENGGYYFNEINTIPGFTPISMYPEMMKAAGVGYSSLIDNLIELALKEQQDSNQE